MVRPLWGFVLSCVAPGGLGAVVNHALPLARFTNPYDQRRHPPTKGQLRDMSDELIEFAIDGCPPITVELWEFLDLMEELTESDGEVAFVADDAFHVFLNPRSMWFRTMVPFDDLSEETKASLALARGKWLIAHDSE